MTPIAPFPFYILFLNILLFALPQQVHSYCFYNNADPGTDLYVAQRAGAEKTSQRHHFKKKRMHPGENECCPYNYKCCSNVPDRGYPVQFQVSFLSTGSNIISYDVSGVAGGYVIVSGNEYAPKFESFNAEHQSISPEVVKYTSE